MLAQTSTSIENAALFAEMLSLPNDGRYPVLALDPQRRRQRTLEALTAQVVARRSWRRWRNAASPPRSPFLSPGRGGRRPDVIAPDTVDIFRRCASYVDRILKGEKPADLPAQAPIKSSKLVIKSQDAKTLQSRDMPPTCLRSPTR